MKKRKRVMIMNNFKQKTYNKEYLKKVILNKMIEFIEEKGTGLYHKNIWDFFPKTYDKEYIIMENDDEYHEIVEIFIKMTELFFSHEHIIFTPSIDFMMKETDFSDWTILIEDGYEKELKEVKEKRRTVNQIRKELKQFKRMEKEND